MKRLIALALLVAAPALGQINNGWQELPNGWGEIQAAAGSVPATCTTAGMVPLFLGSPLAMACDAGITYDATTDTLTTGTVAARNVTATALATPGSITVTPQGTGGAVTWTYKLVARLADGTTTEAGAASSTAVGNATLSASNFNRLTWSAVTGAVDYRVYRTVAGTSPATTGIIYTGTALTVDDTGLAGGGETAPTVDGTGAVTGARLATVDGTVGTESRFYNTYTSAADNEYGFASWLQAANTFWIGTARNGSGTLRGMYIGPASARWTISAISGTFAPADSENQDIGTATLLPRTIRAGTSYELRTAEGAVWTRGVASEVITLSTSGTTTDSSANLLPANSIIEAVVARVTTTITTATDWKLGDATTPGRFTAANSNLTAGTTAVGLVHVDQAGAAGPRQTTAAKVRVTTTGTPGAGVIRVTVFYRQFTPPAS